MRRHSIRNAEINSRSYQHVPPHEVQRFRNLLIEWPFNMTGVGLIIDIGPLVGVADGLDVGREATVTAPYI